MYSTFIVSLIIFLKVFECFELFPKFEATKGICFPQFPASL